MELTPSTFDLARILGLGTIGLGFLLAFLAFRLLDREQSIDNPREVILGGITRFMIFSFSLCAFGLCAELYRTYYAAMPANNFSSSPQNGVFYLLNKDEVQPARDAAEEFLHRLDIELFTEAYDSFPSFVRSNLALGDFIQHAASLIAYHGSVESRKFNSAFKRVNVGPEGTLMMYDISFRTNYENVKNAADTVTLIRDSDGVFRAVYYYKQQ